MEMKEQRVTFADIQQELTELKADGLDMAKGLHRKMLSKQIVRAADGDEPVHIFVGSCPDYAHNGGVYTFEALGSGVPLLSLVHLRCDRPLLNLLQRHRAPFVFELMIADCEAEDEFFATKYTSGDQAEFHLRCKASMAETDKLLDTLRTEYPNGQFKSSSFFTRFGKDGFMATEAAYRQVLYRQMMANEAFASRISNDIRSRMPMYRRNYGDLAHDHDYLVGRTLRTMAQYLALGRLVSKQPGAVMVVHDTTNAGRINDRNRFLLPGDATHRQKPVPLVVMKQKIY